MSNPRQREIQPVETSGDIPWGVIKGRKPLPDKNWFAPQTSVAAAGEYEKAMKAAGRPPDQAEILRLLKAKKVELEAVELANGLRHAVIRDAATGKEEFTDREYHGLVSCGCGAIHESPVTTSAGIIRGTGLGNGHTLAMMITGEGNGGEPPMSQSFVEKEAVDVVNGELAQHSFHYQIDPPAKHFGGRYDYAGGREATSIWLRMPHDEATGKPGQKLAFDVCIADAATDNQTSFIFGDQGNLQQIQLAGVSLLGMEQAAPEFLAPTAESQRGIVVLRGEELKSPRARLIAGRLLGVDFGDELTLNTKETLDNFIKNVDLTSGHRNPRAILSFKGAAKSAGWHPALPEG